MEFVTEAQRAAYEQVLQWVTQLYGESAFVSPEGPSFVLPVPDMTVGLHVQSMGDDEACLDFYAWPSGETKQHDGVLRYLLEQNALYRFGALNLQPNGSLLFELVEPINRLTKDRFSWLLSVVASSAAEIGANLQGPLGQSGSD